MLRVIVETIHDMQPAYDTWNYETDEIGNNNGRGRGEMEGKRGG